MATRTFDRLADVPDLSAAGLWEGLLNGDQGSAFSGSEYPDRCIQVVGTFGAGGTMTLQGSNDGSTWATLKDAFGTPIALTAAGIVQIMEIPRYIRPSVVGDGSTDLDVYLFARHVE